MRNKQHNQNHSLNKIKTRRTPYKKKRDNESHKSSRNPKAFSPQRELYRIVPRLKSESAPQYTAFLVYCESKSISETARELSVKVGQDEGKMSAVFNQFKATPTKRTLERWSKKFRWVERKDRQLAYFNKELAILMKERERAKQKTFIESLFETTAKFNLEHKDGRRFNGRNFTKNKEVGI